MQRIKLLKSQKVLLQMKSVKLREAIALVRVQEKELEATIELVMTEQGVPKAEVDQWKLSDDAQAIEKIGV